MHIITRSDEHVRVPIDHANAYQTSFELLHDFFCYAARLEASTFADVLPLLGQLSHLLDHEKMWVEISAMRWEWRNPMNVWSWASSKQGPSPLLSLSIQYDLGRYAKQTLDSSADLVISQPGRPLLDRALRRRIYKSDHGVAEQLGTSINDSDRPDFELVRTILTHGADPNQAVGDSTVWKLFMQFLDVFTADFRQLMDHEPQSLQPGIQVTELLIRYGAVRVLESETRYPQQSSGRTWIRKTLHEKLAQSSIAVAFSE